MTYTAGENIVERNVEDEMKVSYLRYSMSVIISRALPDVRDGLKPSQRRILYAMRQLNLSPGGKHRKCAKISGDTSGDYHPHGDMVIYPTMVRMAQEWMMRYKLIDGQGNFGSVDGDPPAAMRYTEARLTASSTLLMEDLDKDTVDMLPNYDETKKEPTVMPAKFPNLLCNGSSGIAVGMATNIPPHNLLELVNATKLLLDDSTTTIDAIMEVMPGPDFPTGGLICGYRGIKEAFHTGRGRLILRAVINPETTKEGRERLIIDEIPYGVNKSRLIEQVADLITAKTVTGIADLRDDSDKDGLRIVVELKRNEVPEVIINQLYKYTDMQTTFGCNMLALDKGLPRLMNVKHMISAWIDHRIEVVRRRTRYELNKAEARAHVLEGYLIAIDNLDEVVKVIKSCANREEAKKELSLRFSLSERQSHAVLELRLYQLTGMESDKIQGEYAELLKKIEYLRSILASELLVKGIIKDELDSVVKNHKSPRRTQIVAAEGDMNMEDLIANDPTIITISEDDYIKRMPVDTFREQRRGGHGVAGMQMKREDDVPKGLYAAMMHDYLLIFTNLGRVYWLKAWQIPETGRRSKGRPLINLLEDLRPDEKIATVLQAPSLEGDSYILLATAKGIIKKTRICDFSNPRRKGVWAISIDEEDEVVGVRQVEKGQQIMLFTRNGMAVRFNEADARAMGRIARGVKGVSLRDPSDYVVGLEAVQGDETILIACDKGFGKRSNVGDFRCTKRGGVGVKSIITNERNGLVVGALCVTDSDSIVLMASSGQALRIGMKDMRVMGRNTQGVTLLNLKGDDTIVALQKMGALAGDEDENETGDEETAEISSETAAPEEVKSETDEPQTEE
jgi:DNA gyrase subunit A